MPRQVLSPFARRFNERGWPVGKLRMRPAPSPLSMAAVARRKALTEIAEADQ